MKPCTVINSTILINSIGSTSSITDTNKNNSDRCKTKYSSSMWKKYINSEKVHIIELYEWQLETL